MSEQKRLLMAVGMISIAVLAGTGLFWLGERAKQTGGGRKEIPAMKVEDQVVKNAGEQLVKEKKRTKQIIRNKVQDSPKKPEPTKVKGIYVSGPMAGSGKPMEELIHLVDTTELNAMVIDIKNDAGEITYKMEQEGVEDIGSGVRYIGDMKGLVRKLKKKNIYLIARIVAFKDPLLAKERPDLAVKKKGGGIFFDEKGLPWVNPYKKEVWDYLVRIGEQAADLGFDEVQFDYIRFSTYKSMKEADFGVVNKTKEEIIGEFTKYAYEKLSPMGIFVSADVYGIVMNSGVDQKIVGQNYKKMANHLDYICPMVYPSHYAYGAYEISFPDKQPYQLITSALKDSQKALKSQGKVAKVRPWLQAFTAEWLEHHIPYGEKEIRAQIKGVYDAGYEEWILWNPKNQYTKESFFVDN